MTIHITQRNPTISTNPIHAQTMALIHATATSHHDGLKTNTLNNPQVQLNIIKKSPVELVHGL
jgi:hypothetical protein